MQWRQELRAASVRLQEAGVEGSQHEAIYLWEWASGRGFADWLVHADVVSGDMRERFKEAVERRCRREPLAYIVGHREFFGLSLEVTPHVLIPRPETEVLVEAVLEGVDGSSRRVVDVGTGSGAIALALKAYRPDWQITGVDISAPALEVARRNGARLQLEVDWKESDGLANISGAFEVLVANLPYIDRDWSDATPELAFEPDLALYADDHGLGLMASLIQDCPSWLSNHGKIFLECGEDQGSTIQALLRQRGFIDIQMKTDYAGKDRVVLAKWPV